MTMRIFSLQGFRRSSRGQASWRGNSWATNLGHYGVDGERRLEEVLEESQARHMREHD